MLEEKNGILSSLHTSCSRAALVFGLKVLRSCARGSTFGAESDTRPEVEAFAHLQFGGVDG